MAEISRRRFLTLSGEVSLVAATNATGLLHLAGTAAAAAAVTRVDAVPTNVIRSWIAPQYWANRLQDWQTGEDSHRRGNCRIGARLTSGSGAQAATGG